jgi:nitrate reductase gamma subunit
MTLLEFTEGPGLRWAILIMTAGFCARLVFSILVPREQDLYWARKEFGLPGERWKFDSILMHAGLLLAIFGFAPHILLIRDLTGLQWPSLPISIVWFAAAATVIAMLWLLGYRLSDRTRRELTTVDDYLSWILVFAPVVTGMLAFPHLGGGSLFGPDAMLLTAHLMSVELLMVYLPFGKLMHLILMPMFRAALFVAGSLRGRPEALSPVNPERR